MAKRQKNLAASLRKLGARVRDGWTKLNPVSEAELKPVREVVRKQWEQQQKVRKAFQRQPLRSPPDTAVEVKSAISAQQQLASTVKAITNLTNPSPNPKSTSGSGRPNKKANKYTGTSLRKQPGSAQTSQPTPKSAAKSTRRKG